MWPQHRTVAVEIDVVNEDALLLAALRLLESRRIIGARTGVQRSVTIGAAPAQISNKGLARQIVRQQTFGRGVNERQPAQPVEQVMDIWNGEHLRKQWLRRQPQQRADLQRCALDRLERLLYHTVEQRAHDVWVGLRRVGRVGTLRIDIRHERERQRMPMREGERANEAILWHATIRQICPAILRAKVSQWQRAHKRLPARIGAPGGSEWIAAR